MKRVYNIALGVAVALGPVVACVDGAVNDKVNDKNAAIAGTFCEVTYDDASQWTGGFKADVTVKNTSGAALDHWSLSWTFPGDQKIQSSWNAKVAQSGAKVTADGEGWNAAIAANQSASFGFVATGAAGRPTDFAVNGVACNKPGGDTTTGAGTGGGSGSGGSDPGPTGGGGASGPTGPGTFRVNPTNGHLTRNGTEFQVRGGSWFGLEGQDDLDRPGAMELFIGASWWADASAKRTIADTMREIKTSGLKFNTIRLPIAPQTLIADHPDGDYSRTSPRIRNNDATLYPYANALEALEDFLKQAAENDLYVILGMHSCSNHIGWRKGTLNDSPPFVDSVPGNRYAKDNYTCASGEDAYNRDKWLADIRTMARLPKKLGIHNILGIDCFNEPWKYKWADWADLAKACYDVIAEEDDDMIAVVQGVSSKHELPDRSLEAEPFGDPAINPNWGENFYGQKDYPVQIPKERVCFSPHTYGPSVYVQQHHVDQSKPGCAGLEDDAAAAAGCGLVTTRDNAAAVAQMRKGWDEHFGYLHDQGYCVITGEFGGMKTWPINPAEPAAAQRWAHLPSNIRYDWEWQNIYVDYLKDKGMTDFLYWSINPESGDTGGLYNHAFSQSNPGGWGTWEGLDTEKVEMLSRLK